MFIPSTGAMELADGTILKPKKPSQENKAHVVNKKQKKAKKEKEEKSTCSESYFSDWTLVFKFCHFIKNTTSDFHPSNRPK